MSRRRTKSPNRPVRFEFDPLPERSQRRPGKEFSLSDGRYNMRLARSACLAFVVSAALSTLGCCYHAANFGRARDIGWGEIGCSTCNKNDGCCTDGCRPGTTEPIPAPKLPPVRLEKLP